MEVGRKTEKQSILASGEFKGFKATITIRTVDPENNTLKDKNIWLLSDDKYTPGNTGRVAPKDVAQVTAELINSGANIESTMMIPGYEGTLAGVVFITS